MIQKTKQELRDEIVTLTMRNKTLEITGRNAIKEIGEQEIQIEGLKLEVAGGKYSTIAAYALLATLVCIMIMEFVL